MSCLGTLAGIGTTCAGNIGGIDELYIADYEGVDVTATTAMTISSITGDSRFYTYTLEDETGSFNSTVTKGSGGVLFYTHEISVQFPKQSAAKHLELQAITKGRVACVVKDNNGVYHYFGADRYLSGEDTVAQTGSAFEDLNGYSTVIRGKSATMPYILEGTALTSFLSMIVAAPVEAS